MQRMKTLFVAAALLGTAGAALCPTTVQAQASKPAASASASVPQDLLGEWSWTTITGVVYQDIYTKKDSGPSGMAMKFNFMKGGRYKSFYYIRMQTYSLVNQSSTTEEGTVTFKDNGTFVVKPAKGHYLGRMGTRPIDRDMTAAERKPKTYYWEWRTTESGERALYIGPSKDSMSHFKRS